MVLKGMIAPVSRPTAWVSLLTYPHKPDGSLCICLDPKDLNKAIVWEHYKAPTLDEISHHLTLSLLPHIFIEPSPSTASFCLMNDIVLIPILQKLAVPRVCNSSNDYVLPY